MANAVRKRNLLTKVQVNDASLSEESDITDGVSRASHSLFFLNKEITEQALGDRVLRFWGATIPRAWRNFYQGKFLMLFPIYARTRPWVRLFHYIISIVVLEYH